MIEVFTDGRAEPNPGLGTYGFVVYENGKRIIADRGVAGRGVSNNYAEYSCLVKALERLHSRRSEQIKVYSDSSLLVNQMNGKWKFKGGNYSEKLLEARDAVKGFSNLSFEWIPRERNAEADELTNIAYSEVRDR